MIKHAAVCIFLEFRSSAVAMMRLERVLKLEAAADLCARLGKGLERWRATWESRENMNGVSGPTKALRRQKTVVK